MTTSLPVLYSFRRCPYAMRARLALAVGGQRYELREVVLRDKPQALRDASPKATVPVLVLPDGPVVDESLDIMLWALRRNDPQEWLVPQNEDLAAMLTLVAQCDGLFKHHLDRYKYPQRYAVSGRDSETSAAAANTFPKNPGVAAAPAGGGGGDGVAVDPAAHRAAAGQWLLELEARLGGGFLFGARPALADMAIAPFVRQYAYVDLPWFVAQPWPRLSSWLAAWMDSGLFSQVMKKYAPWAEGAERVFGPRL